MGKEQKVVRITSVIFLIYGCFSLFTVLVAGRGIVLLFLAGWIVMALAVFCIVLFWLGSRFVKGDIGTSAMRALSIAMFAVSAVAVLFASPIHSVCAVLAFINVAAIRAGKKRGM